MSQKKESLIYERLARPREQKSGAHRIGRALSGQLEVDLTLSTGLHDRVVVEEGGEHSVVLSLSFEEHLPTPRRYMAELKATPVAQQPTVSPQVIYQKMETGLMEHRGQYKEIRPEIRLAIGAGMSVHIFELRMPRNGEEAELRQQASLINYLDGRERSIWQAEQVYIERVTVHRVVDRRGDLSWAEVVVKHPELERMLEIDLPGHEFVHLLCTEDDVIVDYGQDEMDEFLVLGYTDLDVVGLKVRFVDSEKQGRARVVGAGYDFRANLGKGLRPGYERYLFPPSPELITESNVWGQNYIHRAIDTAAY